MRACAICLETKHWRGLSANYTPRTGKHATTALNAHLYMLPSLCCAFGVAVDLLLHVGDLEARALTRWAGT
jgi:hypothetical protein